MTKHIAFLVAGGLMIATAHAQKPQPPQKDSLLNHLIGQWVLRGPMAGKAVVHDVTFRWVLGGEYVEMHEVSRERMPTGTPAYEAIAYLVHDPHSHEYAALWLDNTDYNAFLPAGQGHGFAAADSIPFVFTTSSTDHTYNTFVYHRATNAWEWHIDNEDASARRSFARVTLSRQ
jgi:hypothetical protein